MKWVKIIGVVVAVDEFTGRRIYTVDDSSGACIDCSCIIPASAPTDLRGGPAQSHKKDSVTKAAIKTDDTKTQEHGVDNPNVPYGVIDVGTVLKIKGRIGSFRDMMQIEVVTAVVVRLTEMEVKFWDEAMKFKKEVLENAWVLSDEKVEEMRKKDEKRRKRKHKRKKEKGRVDRNQIRGEEIVDAKFSKSALEQKRVPDMQRKKHHHRSGDDGNAAKMLLEEEIKKRTMQHKVDLKNDGIDGGIQTPQPVEGKKRRFKDFESTKNPPRYPSKDFRTAVRKAIAGKYDLLGI